MNSLGKATLLCANCGKRQEYQADYALNARAKTFNKNAKAKLGWRRANSHDVCSGKCRTEYYAAVKAKQVVASASLEEKDADKIRFNWFYRSLCEELGINLLHPIYQGRVHDLAKRAFQLGLRVEREKSEPVCVGGE